MSDAYSPRKIEESELKFIKRWLKGRCDNNEIDKIPNRDALIRTPSDALRVLRGVCEDKDLRAKFSKARSAHNTRKHTPKKKGLDAIVQMPVSTRVRNMVRTLAAETQLSHDELLEHYLADDYFKLV